MKIYHRSEKTLQYMTISINTVLFSMIIYGISLTSADDYIPRSSVPHGKKDGVSNVVFRVFLRLDQRLARLERRIEYYFTAQQYFFDENQDVSLCNRGQSEEPKDKQMPGPDDIVTKGVPISTITPPVRRNNCLDLAQDFLSLADATKATMTESSWESVKQDVQRTLRLDLSSREQVAAYSCRLAKAKSVHEIASILRRPYNDVKEDYEDLTMSIYKSGGVESVQKNARLTEVIVPMMRKTGYPVWPLRTKTDEIKQILEQLIGDIGPDFLLYLKPPLSRELVPFMINVSDIKIITENIVGSGSLEEFCIRMGIRSHLPLVQSLLKPIEDIATSEKPHTHLQVLKVTAGLLEELDSWGLLNLPLWTPN